MDDYFKLIVINNLLFFFDDNLRLVMRRSSCPIGCRMPQLFYASCSEIYDQMVFFLQILNELQDLPDFLEGLHM